MKRSPAAREVPERLSGRTWLLLFISFALLLLLSGFLFYRYEIRSLRADRYNDLQSIGGLKVDQIVQWREEQRRLADINTQDPLLQAAVTAYLRDPAASAGQPLEQRLRLMRSLFQYEDVVLLAPDGQALLPAGHGPVPADGPLTEAIAGALAGGEATFSDLHRDPQQVVVLDIVAPILDEAGRPLALLLLRSNASTFLFPLIQRWPSPSETAETLLVRQDGSDVLFLNELRHRSDTALSLRIPLTQEDLPAVQAIRGRRGETTGLDYRGVSVLAHLEAVPGSPWYLVAKWDASEMADDIRARAVVTVLVVLLFILLAGVGLAYFNRRHQAQLFRDLYRVERQRHQLLGEQQATLASIGDGVIATDPAGRVTFLNPVAAELTGYRLEEARGRLLPEIFSLWDTRSGRPRTNLLERVLAEGESARLANHTLLRGRDGRERQIADSAAPIRDADGEVSGAVIVFRDVTERYRMEATLQASEKRYRQLFANAVSGVALHELICDEEGRPVDYLFLDANPAFETHTGLVVADVVGRRVSEVLPGIEESDFIEIYGRVVLTGEPVTFESYSEPLARHFLINAYRVAPGQFASVFQDISQRKQAEEDLRDRHAELTQVFETMPEAVIYTDTERRIARVNAAFVRIFGYEAEEVLGQPTAVFYADKEVFEEQGEKRYNPQAEPTYEPYEVRYLRKNGEEFTGETVGAPMRDSQGRLLGMLGLIRDVSARKQMEAEKRLLQDQLIQAQRIESIGRLAGGVAHDFNNMLSVITGSAELALRRVDAGGPVARDLRHILDAAQRSGALTGQLLGFARKQTIAPRVVDLNETVAGMLSMLERLIGEDIDLAWRPGDGLWSVKIDPVQLDQVLANLCVNARDAIDDAGKITVETGKITFDESYVRTHAGFLPGDYLLLAVTDNGQGMDKETLSHIFEPFFTTKGVHEGTGLGLATVYGIVRQNGGFINVYSEPGRGTTFRIYFPRYTGPVTPPPVAAPPAASSHEEKTILLVEDEPAILEVVQSLLETEAYTVLAASTPAEALRLAQEYDGPLDLLVTDVVMPEMSGRELAERLQALYPGLRRLFMSGYTANAIVHQGVLEEGVNFIQKPFSIEAITAKVRELMKGPDGT